MSIPGDASPLLLGGGGAQQYKIERSLRFNSSDSAYLSRTPASAGNRKTWTWSGWVKRSQIGSGDQALFTCLSGTSNTNTTYFALIFRDDKILVGGVANAFVITTQVFRDPSAWYHIVLAIDTTQASAANTLKLHVNGTQITAFSTDARASYTSSSVDLGINQALEHGIARNAQSGGNQYFNGYLADIHFIDGQALDPTSFAETNITTGQWVPKAFTGTYGTNGFRLAFADNSNNTATTLGKDSSGNGNNWTPNNLSVTTGAGNDSLVDTPTSYGTDTGAGGEVRGNYATLNPLANGGNTLSKGNLDAAGGTDKTTLSTVGMSSGKWYCEVTINAVGTSSHVGIAKNDIALSNWLGNSPVGWSYGNNGQKYNNNSGSAYGNSYTTGNVIGIAFDADVGSLFFYKNGTIQNSGTAAFTGLTSGPYFFAFGAAGPNVTFNYGARPFAYTAPSGFKALVDTNLPTPVVAKPNSVFDVKLYTGNGSTQTISGLGFSPDFAWIKQRSGTEWHGLFDTVRGVLKPLFSNAADAEGSGSGISAFASNGFDLTNNAYVNGNLSTYVAWAWDAGSSTVTNTQGSITSQVRANASAGFSIVTYTGDRTSAGNSTIGHGLGIAPSLVITKSRSNSSRWAVQHLSLGSDDYLSLNTTDAFADSVAVGAGALPKPTSTVFYGSWLQGLNINGETFVAYCFAPVAGYSSFGSYTGNGSADGPFVYTGMRPRWILIKETPAIGNWIVWDTSRSSFNVMDDVLFPNSNSAEVTDPSIYLDVLSNGFKIRSTSDDYNGNTSTFIYAAFAESPLQYARAR